MRLLLVLLLASYAVSASRAQIQETVGTRQVLDLLNQQSKCWSEANIDCFMEHYWKSDSLRFVSKNGVSYGWQKVYDNYVEKYDSPEKMGHLRFEMESAEQLSDKQIFVIGSWNLEREEGPVGGYFSLLWRKIKGAWVIVIDHTS